MDENVTDEGESDKEVKPVSKRKRLEDAEESPHHTEESDEENPDSEGRPAEDILQDAQNGNEEEHHSEEKQADELSRGSREPNEEDPSDSEGNQEKDDSAGSPIKQEKPHVEPSSPDDAGDPEISDDEPLVLASSLAFTYPKQKSCVSGVLSLVGFNCLFSPLDAEQVDGSSSEEGFKASTMSGLINFYHLTLLGCGRGLQILVQSGGVYSLVWKAEEKEEWEKANKCNELQLGWA